MSGDFDAYVQVVSVDVVISTAAAPVVSLAMVVVVLVVEGAVPMVLPEVDMRAAEAMVDAAPTSM